MRTVRSNRHPGRIPADLAAELQAKLGDGGGRTRSEFAVAGEHLADYLPQLSVSQPALKGFQY